MATNKKWARKAAKSYAEDVRKGTPNPGPTKGPVTKTQKLLANGPKFQDVRDAMYVSKVGNKAKEKKVK